MSILLCADTRVVVQGITGREGSFHTQQMQQLGTRVVGGTSPGKGGTTHLDVPVFDTVAGTKIDATCRYLPTHIGRSARDRRPMDRRVRTRTRAFTP